MRQPGDAIVETRTNGENVLVDIKCGAVQRDRLPVGLSCTKANEGAAHMLEVERKVLGTHAWEFGSDDIPVTDKVNRRCTCNTGRRRLIDYWWIAGRKADFDLGVMKLGGRADPIGTASRR